MKSKTAIQTEFGKPLIIDYVDIPNPEPDQVIVKLFATGVCHSQIHQMHDPSVSRPAVLGHEATGLVTHIGNEVKHVKEGDHVIVTWVTRNGLIGRPSRVPPGSTYKNEVIHDVLVHTWGENVLIKAEYVIPISKEFPTDITSIIGCAVLTGAGAVVNTAKVRPGNSVAIFGLGGVGLSAIQAASIVGAYPIIAVDLKDDKLQFAKEFGATHLINASVVNPVETIVELSGGVDYAFDTIGVNVTTEQIFQVIRSGGPGADNHGGMAVLVGIPSKSLTVDPNLFVYHHRIYRGSLGATYPDRDFPMFLRWYTEGRFPLNKMVTKRYKLDQINEAYDALASGSILGRSIIEY